jgi:enamine deaminase RidA (YjgF/YER057c/UK114 family)
MSDTLPVIGETIEAQTAAVFDRLRAVLADAGARLDQVVQMRVYLADMVGEMARFNTAYVEAMGTHRPVRTTVGCELNGVKVEIDAVAYVGTDVSSSR